MFVITWPSLNTTPFEIDGETMHYVSHRVDPWGCDSTWKLSDATPFDSFDEASVVEKFLQDNSPWELNTTVLEVE